MLLTIFKCICCDAAGLKGVSFTSASGGKDVLRQLSRRRSTVTTEVVSKAFPIAGEKTRWDGGEWSGAGDKADLGFVKDGWFTAVDFPPDD